METQNDSVLKCSLLRRFVLDRILEHGNQKLICKTRLLNKERKIKIEKGINTAKVNLSNIQQLVDSNLSCQIKYLHIFVRGKLENLEKQFLHYATYFPNIKSINIVITKACYGYRKGNYVTGKKRLLQLELRKSLILQNMNISNKSDLDTLVIDGNQFDVTIRDCNFDGLEVFCDTVATISIRNSQFKNSKCNGLTFWMFNSLILEKIIVNKSGGTGCRISTDVGFAKLTDIRVSECARHGIYFMGWDIFPVKFEFENVHIDHSGKSGILFSDVNGEIKNSSIKRCESYGIFVDSDENSVVRYASIEFEENKKGNIHVGYNLD